MYDDPLTLYKLIVLYMLNRASEPLTTAHIIDFVLGKDYTDFLTLQQVFHDLREADLIHSRTYRNSFPSHRRGDRRSISLKTASTM